MSSGAAPTAAVNSANDAAEPARLIAVVCVGLAITSVLVPLRCYVRLRVMKNFGIDDWFLILAQIFLIISGATTLRSIRFGLGRYLDEVPIWYQDDLLRYLFLNEILYAFLILLIRLTIGFLLLKIITHHRKERAFVIFVLVVSSLNAIQFIIWAFLQCQPLPHFWNRLSPGVCHERAFTIVLYVSSLINILTEWALAFLPVYMAVRMLIMSLKDRIAIAVVLGMGALASVATCVRMVYLGILLEGNADVRYMCAIIYMWATIENCLAIIAACLATFRPLLAKVLDMTVRKASIGDFSGRMLRKPSETTHAMTVSRRGNSYILPDEHSNAVVPDYSDRILAELDKDDLDDGPAHECTDGEEKTGIERTTHIVMEIREDSEKKEEV
ncbi:hypothetical protein B9Z65_883 [Elsinoe australis]|uniref:Rhodopsin domain-containing protein n=1 Tax=Elsinoe australis TaxID=40998 RepID=A0A2P8AJT0_9PEZI|nr:hypothetical protein B9Z65_883 [Elsinoe australis]